MTESRNNNGTIIERALIKTVKEPDKLIKEYYTGGVISKKTIANSVNEKEILIEKYYSKGVLSSITKNKYNEDGIKEYTEYCDEKENVDSVSIEKGSEYKVIEDYDKTTKVTAKNYRGTSYTTYDYYENDDLSIRYTSYTIQDKDGENYSVVYENDTNVLMSEERGKNGNLISRTVIASGEDYTKYTETYKNGNLIERTVYKENFENGNSYYYYTEEYNKGEKQNTKYYNEGNELLKEEYYINGIKQYTEEFNNYGVNKVILEKGAKYIVNSSDNIEIYNSENKQIQPYKVNDVENIKYSTYNITYNEDGSCSVVYKNNTLKVMDETVDRNGNITERKVYNDGNYTNYVEYYESGKLKSVRLDEATQYTVTEDYNATNKIIVRGSNNAQVNVYAINNDGLKLEYDNYTIICNADGTNTTKYAKGNTILMQETRTSAGVLKSRTLYDNGKISNTTVYNQGNVEYTESYVNGELSEVLLYNATKYNNTQITTQNPVKIISSEGKYLEIEANNSYTQCAVNFNSNGTSNIQYKDGTTLKKEVIYDSNIKIEQEIIYNGDNTKKINYKNEQVNSVENYKNGTKTSVYYYNGSESYKTRKYTSCEIYKNGYTEFKDKDGNITGIEIKSYGSYDVNFAYGQNLAYNIYDSKGNTIKLYDYNTDTDKVEYTSYTINSNYPTYTVTYKQNNTTVMQEQRISTTGNLISRSIYNEENDSEKYIVYKIGTGNIEQTTYKINNVQQYKEEYDEQGKLENVYLYNGSYSITNKTNIIIDIYNSQNNKISSCSPSYVDYTIEKNNNNTYTIKFKAGNYDYKFVCDEDGNLVNT